MHRHAHDGVGPQLRTSIGNGCVALPHVHAVGFHDARHFHIVVDDERHAGLATHRRDRASTQHHRYLGHLLLAQLHERRAAGDGLLDAIRKRALPQPCVIGDRVQSQCLAQLLTWIHRSSFPLLPFSACRP